MGGEGGFIEKIMALLGQGGGKPPVPAPSPEPRVPWETPMSSSPVGVSPMMPSAPVELGPEPSIAEDPMAQAVDLARKRKMIQRMIPTQ